MSHHITLKVDLREWCATHGTDMTTLGKSAGIDRATMSRTTSGKTSVSVQFVARLLAATEPILNGPPGERFDHFFTITPDS